MRPNTYRRKLSQDLPRWREAGWVSQDGAAAILAEQGEGHSALAFSQLLAILGALLLGLGVIAFVAANWQEMPRLVRLAAIVATMAGSFGVAAWLQRRELFLFSEAAMLLSGLVYAGGIALVGQAYHLSGEFSGAVLLWSVGALAAALLVRSQALITLVLLAACYWSFLHAEAHIVPDLQGLVLILVAGAAAIWLGGKPALFATVVAVFYWLAQTVYSVGRLLDWNSGGGLTLLLCLALLFWALGSALATTREEGHLSDFGLTLRPPSLIAVLILAAFLQSIVHWSRGSEEGWMIVAGVVLVIAVAIAFLAWLRNGATIVDAVAVAVIGVGAILFAYWTVGDSVPERLAGSALVILAALWAVNLGQQGMLRTEKTLGLTVFGLEILYLYVDTIGKIIDTALAFLLGGLLFIGLSALLFRIDRHLTARHAREAV